MRSTTTSGQTWLLLNGGKFSSFRGWVLNAEISIHQDERSFHAAMNDDGGAVLAFVDDDGDPVYLRTLSTWREDPVYSDDIGAVLAFVDEDGDPSDSGSGWSCIEVSSDGNTITSTDLEGTVIATTASADDGSTKTVVSFASGRKGGRPGEGMPSDEVTTFSSSVLRVGGDGRVLSVSGAAASASSGEEPVEVCSDGSIVTYHTGGGSTMVSDGGRTLVH